MARRGVPLQIDVWSDVSCPWCYVAKVRLDEAIRQVEAEVKSTSPICSIKWHPYMIDLKTNPAGEEYLAYNRRRWGSDSWTISLKRAGAKDGAIFGNWKWWPFSLHAHRLVLFAERYGKSSEAEHLMFTLTYEEGQNVSDLEVLSLAGERLGLPNCREYLFSEEGRREVLQEDKAAKETHGISAVPVIRVDGCGSVSGAQEAKKYAQIIRTALKLAS